MRGELGGLDDLPVELVLEALVNLVVRDLLRCRMVCKSLKSLIDQSVVMQYKIRLDICGYVDGPRNLGGTFSSTASRLEALKTHINRWKYLDWVESRIRIPGNVSSPDYTRFMAGGVFSGYDGIVLTCVELPSIVRGSPGRTWSHTDLGFRVVSFITDPEQDLLLLVQLVESQPSAPNQSTPCKIILHLRTLSSNTGHPQALSATLSPPGRINESDRRSLFLIIMGDCVGCVYRGESGLHNSIMIWNWCSGEVVLDLCNVSTSVRSFLCIGQMTILMPKGNAENDAVDDIALYEIRDQTTLLEIFSLGLPEIDDYSKFTAVQIFGGSTSLNSSHQMRRRQVPFSALDGAMINIQLHLVSILGDDPISYNLLLSKSLIQHYACSVSRGSISPEPFGASAGSPAIRYVIWSYWGPEHTRLMELAGSNSIGRECVHSNRCIVSPRSPSVIGVLDFTPSLREWSYPLDASLVPHNDSRTTFFDHSTPEVVSSFLHHLDYIYISTRLPYRRTERPYYGEDGQNGLVNIYGNSGRVSVDDEHIVMMMNDEDRGDSSQLIILTL